MRNTFLILTFLLFSLTSNSCEIVGPENIIYNSKENSTAALKRLSLNNCSDKEVREIHASLSDFEGTIREKTLLAEIPSSKIRVKKRITIKRLETLLNEKVSLPKDWKLINPQILGSSNKTISFKKSSIVSIECQSCQNTGHKNLKIEIYNHISSQKKVVWIKASVAVRTSVLTAKLILPVNHKGLRVSYVKNDEFYSISPEAFFTNKDQLIFYKLNKPIKRGQPIKFTDLTALNLIKPGQMVRTNLKSGVIKLKGSAIPVRAGKLGEVVQLRTSNSKKIIIGRVTNFNEVEVEL